MENNNEEYRYGYKSFLNGYLSKPVLELINSDTKYHNPIPLTISLENEYNLIQRKESSLSKSQREIVIDMYNKKPRT